MESRSYFAVFMLLSIYMYKYSDKWTTCTCCVIALRRSFEVHIVIVVIIIMGLIIVK